MDIFDFAIQMEKDGEAYYREIAKKTGDKGVSTIMNILADEEVRHYQIFQQMKSHTPDLPETKVLSEVKNIFAMMRENNEQPSPDASQIEMYKKAQELEKKSQEFYEEKSGEVESPAQKELLLRIAEEEKRHFFLLENIIEFVCKPQTWLENAEFNKLEQY
jgi:rubrerythrin